MDTISGRRPWPTETHMLASLFNRRASVARLVQLYGAGTRWIVAPMHVNDAGIHYEQAEPMVVEVGEPAELGAAFRSAFDAYSVRGDGPVATKKSEWPAYRASGLPSIRAFERNYTAIRCEGLNPSNAIVRATRVYPGDPELELSISFNPLLHVREIGERLLRLAAVGAGA
jgi:hypothetical protein